MESHMSRVRSGAFASLLVALAVIFPSTSSFGSWGVVDANAERKSFVITSDEVVAAPQAGPVYAVIEYGVITKIFYWTPQNKYLWPAEISVGPLSLETLQEVVIVATVPENYMVAYVAPDGSTQAEAINHSDRVEIAQSVSTVNSTPEVATVSTPVVATSVANDYSTSITVTPVSNSNPEKTVAVQVITNGLSYTSITTDNSSSPITITNLPQDSLVTVQTVIRDIQSNSEQVLQDTLVQTPQAELPVLTNARDPLADQQSVSRPEILSASTSDAGAKSAVISFGGISNFNPETTSAGVMVVGPQGETTFIGVGGNGGSVTVNDLSPNLNYTLKLVIRDLATGEETIISGNQIQGA